jgi:hypothetical protein
LRLSISVFSHNRRSTGTRQAAGEQRRSSPHQSIANLESQIFDQNKDAYQCEYLLIMKFKITIRLTDDATVSLLQQQSDSAVTKATTTTSTTTSSPFTTPPLSSTNSPVLKHRHGSPLQQRPIHDSPASHPLRLIVFHGLISSSIDAADPVVWFASPLGPLPQRCEKEIKIEWDDTDIFVGVEKALPFTTYIEGVHCQPWALGRTVLPTEILIDENMYKSIPSDKHRKVQTPPSKPLGLVPKRQFYEIIYKDSTGGDDVRLGYSVMNPFLHALRVHVGMNITVSVPVSVPIVNPLTAAATTTTPHQGSSSLNMYGQGFEESEALEKARRMSQRFGRRSFITATAVLGIKPIVPPPPQYKIEWQEIPQISPPLSPLGEIDLSNAMNSHDLFASLELNAESWCHIVPKRYIIVAFTSDEVINPHTLLGKNGLSVSSLLIKFPSVPDHGELTVTEIDAYYDGQKGWDIPQNCLPTETTTSSKKRHLGRKLNQTTDPVLIAQQELELLKSEMFQLIPAHHNLHEYLVTMRHQ